MGFVEGRPTLWLTVIKFKSPENFVRPATRPYSGIFGRLIILVTKI